MASENMTRENDEQQPYPRPEVGVGPWEGEWPRGADGAVTEPYDPQLLENGDRRNVIDRYRYWSMDAIRADLRAHSSALHIAIENLEHDLNIGSIVRTGNAFNVGAVHIVGRRKWNRRGAMVTDRYLDIMHHPSPDDLAQWAREHDYHVVAVDNMEGSTQLEHTELPERCLLVFGQESTGISPELLATAEKFVYIPQFGSTRSMNVAAAAAIAMHWWIAQYRA
ncbi:MAG: TrmH family RNA methyltransferase [Actinomycetaceae bacterium]|nr:TrmH family RNA methyltransferase [Actinomycetaceae bacterium]